MIAISTAFKNAQLCYNINNCEEYIEIDSNCKHSENVLKTLNELLEKNNFNINSSDCVATIVGPGSFTGIRIGIAIAKALACVNKNLKLISLSSLDYIAYSYLRDNKEEKDFYVILNALSGLFFVCKYDKDGNKIGEEEMIDKAQLETIEGNIIGISEENLTDLNVTLNAQYLLDFALEKYNKKEFVSEKNLIPVYIRKSQAEDNLKNN